MIFEKIKISEISLVVRGSSPRPQGDPRFFGGNIPRLTIRDVTRDGKYVTPILDSLTELGAKQGRVMPKGTLTVSASGTVCVPSFLNVSSSVHDGFFAFKKIFDNYDINFLYYQILLLKKDIKKHINDGGVFKNLNTEIFNNLEVYYTDIKKQIKIVEIIDKQQELIDSYKEKLSLLEKQESYYQEELLSGRIRIKLNPESEIIAINKGFIVDGDLVSGKEQEFEEWLSFNFKDKINFYKKDNEDWSFIYNKDLFLKEIKSKIKVADVTNSGEYPFFNCSESLTKSHNKYINEGEFLLLSTGGKPAVHYYKGKLAYSSDVLCVSINKKVLPYYAFLYWSKKTNIIWKCFQGSGLKHLKFNIFEKEGFYYPKNKIDQILIINLSNIYINQKNNIKEKIKVEEEKMEYLLENLLTGKIRVE